MKPHRIRCQAGHLSSPRPGDVHRGVGVCRACAGNDPVTAEIAFRVRIADLGGTVLEPTWLGSMKPHRVRCEAGHDCKPVPNSVQQGQGICRRCAGSVWDALYVVVNPVLHTLKFGITSGEPRPRLKAHRVAGYTRVEYLATGLPDTQAPDLERAILATLRLAGERPVKGREYYNAHVLTLVMDVIEPLTIS